MNSLHRYMVALVYLIALFQPGRRMRASKEMSRRLRRRWRRSLFVLAVLYVAGQAPALAAVINVVGGCSLVDAITAANNDAPVGNCRAGNGADIVNLRRGSFHALTDATANGFSGLRITSEIIISGNGSTIARDPATIQSFGVLEVGPGGNLALEETTIIGGTSHGVKNETFGTLSINISTISGNRGIGVDNHGLLFITNSTISGNSGGGIFNQSTANIASSTISGNSGSSNGAGGGVNNQSFLTLTNSTVSGNSANFGGGLFNCGSSKLTESLVSGNTAPRGAEIFHNSEACGSVIADLYNLFGHDGVAGVEGFTPGETDIVGNVPLSAILNPSLADNGGPSPTKTLALIPGSPAVDAFPAGLCHGFDQRGAPRPQDGDGNGVADCDIGAFELGARPVEAVPAAQNPKVRCTASRCSIPIKCNLDAQCVVRIDLFVSRSAARSNDPASTKAPGRIRFALGVTNVPPGEIRDVRLTLTKRGRKIVRTSPRRSLRGVLEIRNSVGAVISAGIRIRIRR